MNVGPLVRGLFGPLEPRLADAYRSIYLDVDAMVSLILRWRPSASRILEVGCGEGAMTQRLCLAYPQASITAIDVTPRVGRLFRGEAGRARFLQRSALDIATLNPAAYDLVVLCDVLHHVPAAQRRGLLDAVRLCMAPEGAFVFKDWQRSNTPIHWLCHASDRWLTGDRISYLSRDEMRQGLAASFGSAALNTEARVAPWWNNLAFLVQPSKSKGDAS